MSGATAAVPVATAESPAAFSPALTDAAEVLIANADTRIAAAGLKLNLERPYLSAALWSVQRIATHLVPTMAVDEKWRLYFNPNTVAHWDVDEVMGVLYHEVCHLVREHAARCPAEAKEDPIFGYVWNIATDAEINDDLREESIALPGEPVYPGVIAQKCSLTAEEYYQVLLKDARRKRSAGQGAKRAKAVVVAGRCGSCAGGAKDEWEQGENSASAAASAAGLHGLSSSEAMLVRRSVAVAVREHAQSRGTVPGQWLRWAETILEPTVDWRKELSALVRHALSEVAGATDYRYSRPSRRQSCFPTIVLPSLRQPVPQVAVVLDTSGSISDAMLEGALGEVSGILKAAGLREGVSVLSVDAAVQACQRVFSARQVQPRGGGGTDMGVGIEAASRLKPRPEVVIVITDGYTPWPQNPPSGMKTVVLLTDERGTSPTWARTIVAPRSGVGELS